MKEDTATICRCLWISGQNEIINLRMKLQFTGNFWQTICWLTNNRKNIIYRSIISNLLIDNC
jgi:hypothetical protein